MFLSKHHWPNHSRRSHRSNFPPIIRKGEIELPDERHQDCVHPEEAITSEQLMDQRSISGWHTAAKESAGTHANLHPMQLLVPPEKLMLYRRVPTYETSVNVVEASYSQVMVDAKGRLRFFPHVQPSLRSKFIGIWSPKLLVSAKR